MISPTAQAHLLSLFPRRQVITDPAELLVYETDAAMDRQTPDAVVLAQNQADVVHLVQWAAVHRVPVVSRGAGTGLSGGAVAELGGVILGFARMNRILSIDPGGRSATVEPGVVNLTLDEAVRRFGLYYPPDPASGRSATLGGNVAENAGGPH
jgi:D-lactate dehydrogenase (cytochrome)